MTTVGIHLNRFPLPTETFIVEQARLMSRFRPIFYVRRLLDPSPASKVVSIPDSSLDWRRKLFALFPNAEAWPCIGQPKIVHAHFGTNGIYANVLAVKFGAPLVVTFHGFDATTSRLALLLSGGVGGARLAIGRAGLFRSAGKVIAVSKFIQDELLAQGVPEERLVQHYIGVDTERFRPAGVHQSLDIVCVGRLIRLKGQHILMKSFASICRDFPESRLRIVGDGPERQPLVNLALQLGIAHKVYFEGTLSHAQVAERIRMAAVSVSPSITDRSGAREALGLASLEAAACGIPSIVSDSGGLSETVIAGETGLIMAEGNVMQLATHLRMLLSHDNLRLQMGANARQFVLERFDLKAQTAQLEDVYEDLINERRNHE